jgi:hypothetical protein
MVGVRKEEAVIARSCFQSRSVVLPVFDWMAALLHPEITGTLHEDQCTFFIISGPVILTIRNVLHKSCRENQNTYRVISKSLRDVRPLRYSSRDVYAEGEHVSRGRDTASFCPALQLLVMSFYAVCLGC